MTFDLDAVQRALRCLLGLPLEGLGLRQVGPGLIVVHDAGTELVALDITMTRRAPKVHPPEP